MTYQEAKEKLRKIADGRPSAITYGTMMYRSGDESPQITMYVEGIGYTNHYSKTYEAAFAELAAMLNGDAPVGADQEPDIYHSSRTHRLAGYVLGPSESER